jgi:hypothetical protein
MYKKRTILEVQDWGDKWQVVYIIEHVPDPEDEDQQVWAEQGGHCFPKDIFEWRAAEYGIDPTDMDTLIDIVLSEPFLEDSDFPPGEGLFDAPDISLAREAHKSRCARGKLRGRITTRGKIAHKDGILFKMRTESLMDKEVIDVKKEHVRRQRQSVVPSQMKMMSASSGEQRATELRKALFPREETHND